MKYVDSGWSIARWSRGIPGARALAVLAAAPVLLLAPEVEGPFLGDWGATAKRLTVLYAFIVAVVVGRESGRPGPWLIWLFQKGRSVPDHMLGRWLLDAALATGLLLWWYLVWIAARALHPDVSVIGILASFPGLMASLLIAHAVLFALSATGSERGSDLLVGIWFIAVLQAFALRLLPPPLATALHWVLPPFMDAYPLGGDLIAADWSAVAGSVFQITAYTATCLWIGITALKRWRPASW